MVTNHTISPAPLRVCLDQDGSFERAAAAGVPFSRMSLQMIQAVKFIAVTPTQKLVAFVLADCHNAATGQCNPSGSYLERVTGFSNRTIWTALDALESMGHLTVRNKGNGSKNYYTLHPKTSEGGSLVDCETSEGGSPVNLLQPVKEVHTPCEPVAKTCEPVAKTSEGGSHITVEPEEPEGTGTSKAKAAKKEDDSDFQNACMMELDLTASRALKMAWMEWQQYRQSRHKSKGAAKLEWTAQAARLSANDILRAVSKYGEQMVIDRIHRAISDRWKGVNLDSMPAATNGRYSGGASKPRGGPCAGDPCPVDLIRDFNFENPGTVPE